MRWEEAVAEAEKPQPQVAFREGGVYLITGGMGELGLIFAQEIVRQTQQGRVVLTGRSVLTAEKQAQLQELCSDEGRGSYGQVDLGDIEQVGVLIGGMREG